MTSVYEFSYGFGSQEIWAKLVIIKLSCVVKI